MKTNPPKRKKEVKNFVSLKIPKALCSRIERNRKVTGLTIEEFVFDAVSEKLGSIHSERRKKKRL